MKTCLRFLAVRLALLAPLCFLGGGALGAAPSPDAAAFLGAVRATALGDDASKAYFLVHLLNRAEAPKDEVEALRRELLHAYLSQLTAPSHPPAPPPGRWERLLRALPGRASAVPDSVAAAVARGRNRPSVLDAPFRDAWQTAFNQGLSVRWGVGQGRSPNFLMALRDLEPIAPGVWVAPSASGQIWLKLAVRLVNTSSRPLPLHRPGLLFGDASEGGQPGLSFTCQWDRPSTNRPQSEMQANAVTLLPPGAESEPLVCDAPPAAAFWRAQIPALLNASVKPRLVSHDLDSPQRLYHMELALAESAPQASAWSERLLVARQQVGSQWRAGADPLEPPERRRWASAPHEGWRSAAASLKAFMAATVLALGLFAAGRGLLRLGVPPGGVVVGTVAAGAGLFAVMLAQMGGGTGYNHPLYLGIGLWSSFIGPVLLAVLALHGLHKLLDDEGRDWWGVVASGWRRAFDLTQSTSRGEFWGFFAHCAWLWALVRICMAPLDRWIGPVLLLPLLAAAIRRLRSMTLGELAGAGLALAALVLQALA
jgi:hypothetical protein